MFIWIFSIPDPGSRDQKKHRIVDPGPQHCLAIIRIRIQHDPSIHEFVGTAKQDRPCLPAGANDLYRYCFAAGLEQEVQQLTTEKNQLIKYVEVLVKKSNEKLSVKRS